MDTVHRNDDGFEFSKKKESEPTSLAFQSEKVSVNNDKEPCPPTEDKKPEESATEKNSTGSETSVVLPNLTLMMPKSSENTELTQQDSQELSNGHDEKLETPSIPSGKSFGELLNQSEDLPDTVPLQNSEENVGNQDKTIYDQETQILVEDEKENSNQNEEKIEEREGKNSRDNQTSGEAQDISSSQAMTQESASSTPKQIHKKKEKKPEEEPEEDLSNCEADSEMNLQLSESQFMISDVQDNEGEESSNETVKSDSTGSQEKAPEKPSADVSKGKEELSKPCNGVKSTDSKQLPEEKMEVDDEPEVVCEEPSSTKSESEDQNNSESESQEKIVKEDQTKNEKGKQKKSETPEPELMEVDGKSATKGGPGSSKDKDDQPKAKAESKIKDDGQSVQGKDEDVTSNTKDDETEFEKKPEKIEKEIAPRSTRARRETKPKTEKVQDVTEVKKDEVDSKQNEVSSKKVETETLKLEESESKKVDHKCCSCVEGYESKINSIKENIVNISSEISNYMSAKTKNMKKLNSCLLLLKEINSRISGESLDVSVEEDEDEEEEVKTKLPVKRKSRDIKTVKSADTPNKRETPARGKSTRNTISPVKRSRKSSSSEAQSTNNLKRDGVAVFAKWPNSRWYYPGIVEGVIANQLKDTGNVTVCFYDGLRREMKNINVLPAHVVPQGAIICHLEDETEMSVITCDREKENSVSFTLVKQDKSKEVVQMSFNELAIRMAQMKTIKQNLDQLNLEVVPKTVHTVSLDNLVSGRRSRGKSLPAEKEEKTPRGRAEKSSDKGKEKDHLDSPQVPDTTTPSRSATKRRSSSTPKAPATKRRISARQSAKKN